MILHSLTQTADASFLLFILLLMMLMLYMKRHTERDNKALSKESLYTIPYWLHMQHTHKINPFKAANVQESQPPHN